MGKFRQLMTELSAGDTVGRVLLLHFFLLSFAYTLYFSEFCFEVTNMSLQGDCRIDDIVLQTKSH